MEMREWVERLMGLGPEWRIKRVDEDSEHQEARVALARKAGSALRCPQCGGHVRATTCGTDVRVAGDRLATRGERACGVAATTLELDGGRRDHGARAVRRRLSVDRTFSAATST